MKPKQLSTSPGLSHNCADIVLLASFGLGAVMPWWPKDCLFGISWCAVKLFYFYTQLSSFHCWSLNSHKMYKINEIWTFSVKDEIQCCQNLISRLRSCKFSHLLVQTLPIFELAVQFQSPVITLTVAPAHQCQSKPCAHLLPLFNWCSPSAQAEPALPWTEVNTF